MSPRFSVVSCTLLGAGTHDIICCFIRCGLHFACDRSAACLVHFRAHVSIVQLGKEPHQTLAADSASRFRHATCWCDHVTLGSEASKSSRWMTFKEFYPSYSRFRRTFCCIFTELFHVFVSDSALSTSIVCLSIPPPQTPIHKCVKVPVLRC